ncbi:MAG: U32 family peptidase C-terminal domain-containing protein [Acidobacteriota bacterium]|jgi:hypothetical protein|nr:U32 family peptidase C-terminal domain-containing protein [Acidobacteriota bacterium]
MQVKGPIDWFEVLEIIGETAHIRLKTFEGDEYELELAKGDCVRATIPDISDEEMEEVDERIGANSYPLFEDYLSKPLPPELAVLASDEGEEQQPQIAQSARHGNKLNKLFDELERLEPRLRDNVCIECGVPEQLAVTQEGIVSVCRRCGSSRKIDADLLQRLVDALDIKCFSCGDGALRGEATEYANILKCQNPACASTNSWRGASDRFNER